MNDATDRERDDANAELLARALKEEAAMVETDPSALQKIQRRTRPGSAPSRRGWLVGALGAGLAAAAVITAVVLVADNNDDGGTTIAGSPSTSAAPTDGSSTSGGGPAVAAMHDGVYDPAGTNAMMYYLDYSVGSGNVYLYAEPHTVPDDSAVAAVREFLTSRPIDPDYASGWPEGIDVQGVQPGGGSGAATIALFGSADLSSSAGLDARAAETAIQGLIRTAGITEGTVQITYNGETPSRILGVKVPRDGFAVAPEQSADFTVVTRAPIQVTSPVEGQVVSNPVVVTGDGNVFEGTVNWQLLDEKGREIDSGFVTTAFAAWAPFEVKLGTLDPGTYTFRALEYSAEDGSELNLDDKTFTVE